MNQQPMAEAGGVVMRLIATLKNAGPASDNMRAGTTGSASYRYATVAAIEGAIVPRYLLALRWTSQPFVEHFAAEVNTNLRISGLSQVHTAREDPIDNVDRALPDCVSGRGVTAIQCLTYVTLKNHEKLATRTMRPLCGGHWLGEQAIPVLRNSHLEVSEDLPGICAHPLREIEHRSPPKGCGNASTQAATKLLRLEIHPTSAHGANADDNDSRYPPAQRLTIEV